MGELPPLTKVTQEEIEKARRMTPDEKLREGFRLYEEECRQLTDEIRREFPDADDKEVRRMLNEKLDIIHVRAGREHCLSLGLIP